MSLPRKGPRSRSVSSLGLILCVCCVLAGAIIAATKCDFCGKPITDRYIEFDGHVYHPDCYQQNVAPKCAFCGQILGDNWVVYEGQNYHQQCFEQNVAIRCSRCGGIIEGEYLIDHWGNKYHKYHEQEEPTCSFCGRFLSDPVAGGGQAFSPDKWICNHCAQGAITDEEAGSEILKQVRDSLVKAGIVIDQETIEFELVTRDQFAKLLDHDVTNQFGLTQYEHFKYLGFLEDNSLTIYILTGLPRMHFISTAAHELMHAWLFLNIPDGGDERLIEGSCNYASLLVLRRFDDEMAGYVVQQLEDEPDPVYGEGYRRVKRLAENRGVEYWLEHLRFDPTFPIGY